MKFFGKTVQLTKPVNIFSDIEGRETEKAILLRALYASEPVHVLLVGTPGAGKTIFGKAIVKANPLKNLFIDGTNTSKAGTILEIANKRPAVLFIDEIEKATKDVRAGLLNIMQDGSVTRVLKNEAVRITGLKTCIIASCNHIDKLKSIQPEFLDRMLIVNVKDYSYEQYVKVAVYRLSTMHVNAALAQYIAEQVLAHRGKQDLREVVRIGAMAKTQEDVDRLITDLVNVS